MARRAYTRPGGWFPMRRWPPSQHTQRASEAAMASPAGGGVPIRQNADLAGWGASLVAAPERRAFPGKPEQVALARRFVAGVLSGSGQ